MPWWRRIVKCTGMCSAGRNRWLYAVIGWRSGLRTVDGLNVMLQMDRGQVLGSDEYLSAKSEEGLSVQFKTSTHGYRSRCPSGMLPEEGGLRLHELLEMAFDESSAAARAGQLDTQPDAHEGDAKLSAGAERSATDLRPSSRP